MARPTIHRPDRYQIILLILTLVYIVVFTQLAFAQHAGMRTHQSDLGQMDQAIWNSSRGRFLEFSKDGFQSTRLTDHVEPIFILISPTFWVWNDVRAILFLQVLFVAIGVWPLFALARRLIPPLPALAIAIAYLLNPQLQSALLTEFHAIPLAVPLILWAFWAVEARRWRQFVIAAILLALVKEEAALLAAGFGLWAIWRTALVANFRLRISDREIRFGVAILIFGLTWFLLTTFVIIPSHAATVYGVEQSTYFHRYGALGDSPIDILKNLVTRPRLVWQIASEPARAGYVLTLLAAFGFLGLFGLDVLVLSLPVFLANLLSAYPAQYFGEFHYSAPLVPYFAVAAAYGSARLLRLGQHERWGWFKRWGPIILFVWLLLWAGLGYVRGGRAPLGGRYDPTPSTAHHRLLPRFLDQIPADAAVTATAAVHPHISHRQYANQFPAGLTGDHPADWALLDVTTNTDMAPGDLRDAVMTMFAADWGVVDAADGFLLLARNAPAKEIPPAFYDFVRSQGDPDMAAGPLTFLDIQADDRPYWRQTKLVSHWLVGNDFTPGSVRPWLEVRKPDGGLVYTLDDLTPPALVWYPPDQWQPGDLITITTTPLALPADAGVAIAVVHGPDPKQPGDRLPFESVVLDQPLASTPDQTLALVGAFRRGDDDQLRTMPLQSPDDNGIRNASAKFGLPVGGELAVDAYFPAQAAAGGSVPVWLYWLNDLPPGFVPFVHLRQGDSIISQSDGQPHVFLPGARSDSLTDWRQLQLPPAVRSGENLTLVIGFYDPANGQRLDLLDAAGNPAGNEFTLGLIHITPPLKPDQTCALIPTACDD
ncbi:MAG: DUF2079 domain-containing protein [Caldilineales bacterium]|nr:DUF2079 domain-containing protein [Caldilineales bacterium]